MEWELGYLLPPKLQRRGLVFEWYLVTMDYGVGYYGTCMVGYNGACIMGYYGTCMQVTMIVHERLLWSV